VVEGASLDGDSQRELFLEEVRGGDAVPQKGAAVS
jgi:hypothetical protein